MYQIVVTRLKDGRKGVASGSSSQVVIDHLNASAARHGFEITWNEPRLAGDIWKSGELVAVWEVSKR